LSTACKKCSGLCCRYLALPIETPEKKPDYDDIRWYLAHEGISVFVEEGDWYINITNRCQFLDRKNRCTIYEHRPRICRGYKMDNCDYQDGGYEYEHHFTSLEAFEEYLAKIKKCPSTMNGRATRRKKGTGKRKTRKK